MSTFGESHGPAMGVVIDGLPARLRFNPTGLQKELDRRAPGRSPTSSARREPDRPEILSGILGNRTLGTPIAVIVRNLDQRPADYRALRTRFRPGHGDLTWQMKFGIRDHRGGGRASGRETISRVIAGYFASLVIPKMKVTARCTALGPLDLTKRTPSSNRKVEQFLLKCKQNGESVGGRVTVTVLHCPAGLGEPVFDKLKADLAKAMLSIGGCTSFSLGLGEGFAGITGSALTKNPDAFGGIEGGITNGRPIRFHLTFKPPSTVGRNARQGRHDPCIIPRALPVIEAMTRFVLADHALRQKAYS